MISVIIPVFNAAKTLMRCVDSILGQKFTDFELILVDDGSSDESLQICNDYASKDFRVKVFHQENHGVSVARNVGLDHVSGEYVAFADSDDYVDSMWLYDFAICFGQADVIFQNAVWHYDDGRIFLRSVDVDENLSYREQVCSLYTRHFLGYIWASLFKTNIIQDNHVRFNPKYKSYEDLDFTLSYLMHAASLRILPSRHYHYIFPSEGTRKYAIPNVMRVVQQIEEKTKIQFILGEQLSPQVSNDAGIKYELLSLYSSKESDNRDKKQALRAVYQIRPLDRIGGANWL